MEENDFSYSCSSAVTANQKNQMTIINFFSSILVYDYIRFFIASVLLIGDKIRKIRKFYFPFIVWPISVKY